MAVGRMRFWLGVVAASVTLAAVEQPPQVLTETFVQTVEVQPAWHYEPLTPDVEQHAQCMIDLIGHYGLELTVQNLFIVGDMADLLGGPCRMLP